MSYLRAKIKEQLQLCLAFLGSSDIVLIITYLPMKVKEDKSNLKLFLQKNMFEGKSIETKAKNQSRANKRGNIDPTNSSTKTRFENQSRTCKGVNKSA
jgi:hypothetical protein